MSKITCLHDPNIKLNNASPINRSLIANSAITLHYPCHRAPCGSRYDFSFKLRRIEHQSDSGPRTKSRKTFPYTHCGCECMSSCHRGGNATAEAIKPERQRINLNYSNVFLGFPLNVCCRRRILFVSLTHGHSA